MKINLKNLSFAIPGLFGGIALFLHGYLGYFSRYIADDFCSAFEANRLGVLRSAWYWYLVWSGRFSASILDGVVGRLGPKAVPFIVPITIIVWLTTLTAFFVIFFSPLEKRFWLSVALAVETLFALFLLTPDIKGSLYWGQGMRSAVPPLVTGTIHAILFIFVRSKKWTGPQLALWGILNFFWATGAGGFSETYAAFQVAVFFFSFFVVVAIKKLKFSSTAVFLTSGLLGAIVAFIIVILAPGNSQRQAFYPPHPGIVSLLTISLKSFLTYAAGLVDAPEKGLAIIGVFSLATVAGSQLKREIDSRWLIVIPILTIGFTFLCFLPAAYGISDAPPDRTLILTTYLFLVGILALGIVWGNLLGKQQSVAVSTFLPGVAIITLLLSASINSIHLYRSRPEFIEYAMRWDELDAKILKSKQDGEKQVFIPVIQNWALLNTPNDNPKYWVNICMSGYYDVQILSGNNPSSASP